MKKDSLLIKNANIITGTGEPCFFGELLIENGIITAIGKAPSGTDARVIDACGQYLMPSFTDICLSLGDPSHPSRDSAVSATAAAIWGGFSRIICKSENDIATEATSFLPLEICHAPHPVSPEKIANSPKSIYSDLVSPISDPALLREIMIECRRRDSLLILSSNDSSLVGNGAVSQGRISRMMGVGGIPASAEEIAVSRAVILARETGCRVHIACISSAAALGIIADAKKNGCCNVTCGTSPLHLAMTEDEVAYHGARAKILPPLRRHEDRDALVQGVKSGIIDCISSLHSPFSKEEKATDLACAPFGASMLDLSLSVLITCLVRQGACELSALASTMAINTARLIGRDASLRIGGSADLIIFDPEREWIVSSGSMKSKAVNTPFLGATLYGVLTHHIIGGKDLLN